MNAVGIDVSKGKSMVAILRPFGEIVSSPFEIHHTSGNICSLINEIKSIDGKTRNSAGTVLLASCLFYYHRCLSLSVLKFILLIILFSLE